MIKLRQLTFLVVPLMLSLMASSMVAADNLIEWVKTDNRRFLNAVIKVGDLNRSIEFYTKGLGMSLLSKKDVPQENSTIAIVGFGSQETHFVLHLVYVHGVKKYDIGTSFNHFGIGTRDLHKLVEKIRSIGGLIVKEPGYWFGPGTPLVAYAVDPTGYTLELLQQPMPFEPLNHINTNTANINHSISFFEKTLGMSVLLYQDFPKFNLTVALVGWEKSQTKKIGVIELWQHYHNSSFRLGDGFVEVQVGTDNVYKSADAIKSVVQELGGRIVRSPSPAPVTQVMSTSFVDLSGHTIEIVDNKDYLKEIKKGQ